MDAIFFYYKENTEMRANVSPSGSPIVKEFLLRSLCGLVGEMVLMSVLVGSSRVDWFGKFDPYHSVWGSVWKEWVETKVG